MTPAELAIYAHAYADNQQAAQERAQVQIYSLASLIRPMVWSKHPPRYDRVFPPRATRRAARAMTDDQMYATIKGLNALYGGKEG